MPETVSKQKVSVLFSRTWQSQKNTYSLCCNSLTRFTSLRCTHIKVCKYAAISTLLSKNLKKLNLQKIQVRYAKNNLRIIVIARPVVHIIKNNNRMSAQRGTDNRESTVLAFIPVAYCKLLSFYMHIAFLASSEKMLRHLTVSDQSNVSLFVANLADKMAFKNFNYRYASYRHSRPNCNVRKNIDDKMTHKDSFRNFGKGNSRSGKRRYCLPTYFTR